MVSVRTAGTSRRRVVATVVALACAPLAAACGGEPAVAPAQATPARRASLYTVRLSTWGNEPDRALYEAVTADFNAAHGDVQVAAEHAVTHGLDDHAYHARFAAAVAEGTVADVAHFRGWTWQPYAARGMLHPLNELAARDRWTLPWGSDDAYELQSRFRGKRYFAPSSAAPQLLWLAVGRFRQAGLALPRSDWTYADFQDAARRLTGAVDGRPVFGYQWHRGYRRNMPWWRMHGQLEWDRVAEPRRAVWTAPAVVEAFQYQLYDSQYKLGVSPTQALLRAEPEAYRIEQGGVAMVVDGPPDAVGAKRTGGDAPDVRNEGETRAGGGTITLDVQTLPRGKASRPQHLNLLEGQVMTRTSKDRDAAWEVMKWLGDERAQRRVVESGRMCHTADLCRTLWLPVARRANRVANLDAFVRAMEGSTMYLVGELQEEALDRNAGLGAALDAIRDGALTAKQALEPLQARLQQTLDSFWAAQQGR